MLELWKTIRWYKSRWNSEIIITNDYGLLCEPARSKELTENVLLGLDKNWDSDLIKEYSTQFSWMRFKGKI